MGKCWSIGAAICVAALIALPVRAEVVSDLAPFTWDSDRPQVLVLEGPIDGRAPTLLKRALRRFPSVTTLSLFSEGGSTYAALPMAYEVRDTGLKTTIPAGGACASACSYLFLAGVERSADGPLGVHRIAAGNNNLEMGQVALGDIFGAFEEFGVPTALIARMMQTPPDDMYLFSPEELAALGLIGPATPPAVPDPTPPVAVPPAETPPTDTPPDPVPPVAVAPAASATHIALDIAGEANGRVVIELFDGLAPQNVARLVRLARDGAYDGVVFHRVVDGFMAQTGDVEFGKASGDLARAGAGGSSYPDLPAEFSKESFVAGTVAMARSADPDSANAQFFIMFGPARYLEGEYTIVGQVVDGLEVVRAIKRGDAQSGAVSGAPDRIVRALALAGPDGPEALDQAPDQALDQAPDRAPDPDPDLAAQSPRVEVRFDFTERGRVTLNMGWLLPTKLASNVVCDGRETRVFDDRFVECVNTMSEAEATLMGVGSANGISLSAKSDGSRELVIDVDQFLTQLAPSDEEAMEFKDMRFDFSIVTTRVVETSGVTTPDGTTAQLLLTLQQIVETPGTIPGKFTTRFF